MQIQKNNNFIIKKYYWKKENQLINPDHFLDLIFVTLARSNLLTEYQNVLRKNPQKGIRNLGIIDHVKIRKTRFKKCQN